MPQLKEPTLDEILAFCAEDPVERVFLEDVARRGLGRFTAVDGGSGLAALCHVGSNIVRRAPAAPHSRRSRRPATRGC